MMILGMAFPNIFGVLLLSGKIKADLDDYLLRLRAGAFPRHANGLLTRQRSASEAR
jgi:AGCS family alanine or glycine:cation symporter